MKYVIGIDLGGTNLKAGGISLHGEVLHRCELPAGVADGKEGMLNRILNTIEETRRHIKGKSLAAIGIGIPGIIDIKAGIVKESPNLPGWSDFNIKEFLADKLSWPIYIENDANAFTLAEGWIGSASGIKNFCCLTLGTGVGGGIVLDGRLWRGADGAAGEIGHVAVEPDGAVCGCGSNGCLEMYASANGLVRMAIEDKDNKAAAPLLKKCHGAEGITAKAIAELARQGDPFCRALFSRMAKYLGIGMAALVNVLNIEMIVIGGGLANAGDLFLESAKEEMLKRSLKMTGKRVKVTAAKLGNNGGIIGAAFIALKGERMI